MLLRSFANVVPETEWNLETPTMLRDKKIGFIGGGNMGEALIKGLLRSGLSDSGQLYCSDARSDRLAELQTRHGIRTTGDNAALAGQCDLVVYAVKPQVMGPVVKATAQALDQEKLVISIAAGVPLSAIAAVAGKPLRLVRAMPNVCVSVEAGATAVAPGEHAREGDLELAQAIFESVGRCVIVRNESLLDGVTGLSGSGPAYVFVILDAMADAGVKVGLARDEAMLLAAQTLMGAAKMHLDTEIHPGQLRDIVTSPGGTTIAGLHALERDGIRNAMMDAVEAATLRAKELGQLVRLD
jgi:pyrroline-5-carboxylate reductase